MSQSSTPHLNVLRVHWHEVSAFRTSPIAPHIDGRTLSIAGVVAASRYHAIPTLDESDEAKRRVQAAAVFADSFVKINGSPEKTTASLDTMYGVTTGFGGSAHTRPGASNASKLQQVLIKGLQAGIIPLQSGNDESLNPPDIEGITFEELIMPVPWVKGAIAVRLNSLIRGHSGCRYKVITALHQLLKNDITPCPPLRMSISASGDLGPLGYIAAAITGDANAMVRVGGKVQTASDALASAALPATMLKPKEGLAIVNGTAPSAAVASLVLNDAHFCLLASQVLTGMTLEALQGTEESFVPFLHEYTRPHPGQIEVAANLLRMVAGSHLVQKSGWTEGKADRLRQDRYSLRTAPQWIGPQIEEALSAHQVLTIEVNSTTDNPIIDARPASERGADENWTGNLCGGNFQGTSITIAMEKLRIGLQHAGRIAYSQMVELGSPSMNRGLAPDLAAGEPSLDYCQKPLDIAASSYLAELSFISNTVSNHVQPAEMFNQSINSLALISARYTAKAVRLLQMIYANHLLLACQALDLRAMYRGFFTLMQKDIEMAVETHVSLEDVKLKNRIVEVLMSKALDSFAQTSTLDTHERFSALIRPLVADTFTLLSSFHGSPAYTFHAVEFHASLASNLATSWLKNREEYFSAPPGAAATLMGRGTRNIYLWIRQNLGIPMRKGIELDTEELDKQTSKIFVSIVTGDINEVLLNALSGVDHDAH